MDIGMYGSASLFRSALYRHNRWVEDFSQNWLAEAIERFQNQIRQGDSTSAAQVQLLSDLDEMKGKIKDMKIPDFF
jgi:chromosome condensin MukBEF MukE localization factor